MEFPKNIKMISKEQARRDWLTTRIDLVKRAHKEDPRKMPCLAYVAHPNGGTTVMKAYEILDETDKGYRLRELTEKESKELEHQQGQSAGRAFSASGHRDYRTPD